MDGGLPIVAVYNNVGTKVATYNYSDAWGNHLVSYSYGGSSTGAQYNPFRYRGYYYDTDLVCTICSQDNLNTFMDNPFGIVSASFNVFRYGVYSTISSTVFGAIFYQ